MADENSNTTEDPVKGEESGADNPAPNQGADAAIPLEKGGGDVKTKALGGKGLGDYGKTIHNEKEYD
jgi:hypothetical protein